MRIRVRTLAGTCTASQLDRDVFGLVGDQTIYLHLAGPITSSRAVGGNVL
jgi:hypothetical protein